MIVHILLGKAAAGIDSHEEAELTTALEALRHIPGIQLFSAGVNLSERSKGYTHGAVMYFEGTAELAAYSTHPEHLRVVEILNRVLPDRLVVDYETEMRGISA